jgi:Rhodanese-like domain
MGEFPGSGVAERFVPLAWPQPFRVIWWLAVAGAASAYHRTLRRAGIRRRRIMGVITVAPFLIFAAGIAAGASWATWHRPKRPIGRAPMPTTIDRDELRRLVSDDQAQLVEVLPRAEYDEEHLPGAISVPLKQFDVSVLEPGRPVIVYCWDGL